MTSKTNAQKVTLLRQPAMAADAVIAAANLQHVAPADIRFSTFNYRRHIDQTALEAFAAEIMLHGILSPPYW